VALPTGWYWNPSLYAVFYKQAVLELDRHAFMALDIHWVIETDAFGYQVPAPIKVALANRSRFFLARTFVNEGYHMKIFRVLP